MLAAKAGPGIAGHRARGWPLDSTNWTIDMVFAYCAVGTNIAHASLRFLRIVYSILVFSIENDTSNDHYPHLAVGLSNCKIIDLMSL